MNYRGKYRRQPLAPCRVCGMDAGLRMVTETVPEKFYVVCQICPYKTRAHKTQSAATLEWNGGSK